MTSEVASMTEKTGRNFDFPADLDADAIPTDSVQAYLKEAAKYDILNAEEEVELAKIIEAGVYARMLLNEKSKRISAEDRTALSEVAREGESAKVFFLLSNLRLPPSVAKKYTGKGVPLLDLIQEGNLAMLEKAIPMFDYKKGWKFSTYATRWIRNYMQNAVGLQGRTIELPPHAAQEINKYNNVRIKLRKELARDPSIDEIAGEAKAKPERVLEMLELFSKQDIVSFSMPLGEEGNGAALGDFIEDIDAANPEDVILYREMAMLMESALGSLDEEERKALLLRASEDKLTFLEIGKAMGSSREHARRVYSKAESQLRHPSAASPLHDFADY